MSMERYDSQKVQVKLGAKGGNAASRSGPHPAVPEQSKQGRASGGSQVHRRAQMTKQAHSSKVESQSEESNWDQIQPSDHSESPYNKTGLRSSREASPQVRVTISKVSS